MAILPQNFEAAIKRPAPSDDTDVKGSFHLGRMLSLGLTLFAVWLLLSGIFTPFYIFLGVLSCAISVYIAVRMDVVDHESHPSHLGLRLPGYLLWLAKEIFNANIDVTKRILAPSLPISPTVFRLKASQRDELGQVIYANSITLTPGTVTVDMQGDKLLIHALTKDTADGLMTGDMDRRVTAVEGVSLLDRLLGTQKAKEEGDT